MRCKRGWANGLRPTHDDDAVMDGAPRLRLPLVVGLGRLWEWEGKAEADSSAALRNDKRREMRGGYTASACLKKLLRYWFG